MERRGQRKQQSCDFNGNRQSYRNCRFPYDSNSHINIWYGKHQVFGQKGTAAEMDKYSWKCHKSRQCEFIEVFAQRRSAIAALNAAPSNPRLVSQGDFNVEIACADLLPDVNNIIQIIATDISGKTITAAGNLRISSIQQYGRCRMMSTGAMSLIFQMSPRLLTADG